MIAMKKGVAIDVRKEVVDARNALLMELRNVVIKKTIYTKDTYFDLPDDFDKEIGDSPDDGGSVNDLEDMVVTDMDK